MNESLLESKRRLPMRNRLTIFTIFFILLTVVYPTAGVALDLGLKPGQVYGLWTNINSALFQLASIHAIDAVRLTQIENPGPQALSEKRPADVLEQIAVFRDKLDRLRQISGLAPGEQTPLADELKITPSVVFLHSGQILDSVVLLIIEQTDPGQLVSQFFRRWSFEDKSTGDVYILVELAQRRIDQIIERSLSNVSV